MLENLREEETPVLLIKDGVDPKEEYYTGNEFAFERVISKES
jgi:hypothetical protein